MIAELLTEFSPPPGRLALERGVADVWCEVVRGDGALTSGLLSTDERARADRFHFDRDRRRFIAARTLLRRTLASYLDSNPAALAFTSGPHGKPALAAAGSEIRFNLSHSGEIVVLAVTADAEIGVDVEKIRAGVSFDAIAERYFPPDDARAFLGLSEEEKPREFYTIWTRIEARLKGLGWGLARGTVLDSETDWTTFSFIPATGYAGAVALEDAGSSLRYFSWPN